MSPTAPAAASAPPAPPDASARAARRRLWLWLTLAAALGYVVATPYLLPLFRVALAQAAAAGRWSPPLWVAWLVQLAQVSVLAALCAFAGARAAPAAGLDAPFFRALAERRPPGRRLRAELPLALLVGTGLGAAILAVNQFAGPSLPEALRRHAPPAMAISDRLLALLTGASSAAYGGVVEELLLRWGLLTLFAAGLARLGARGAGGFWIANAAAALLFGAGHLPAAIKLAGPLTAPMVAYVIAGNAIAGLACGVLFKRRGLESAMLAHGWGDVCLHALPLALG